MFRIFRRATALSVAVAIVGVATLDSGCTPNIESPGFHTSQNKIETEACRDSGLDLKNMTPKGVRGLVSCLSGPQKSLAAYESVLKKLSDDDLTVLLSAFNSYLYKNERFSKITSFLETLDQQEILARFYKVLGVLAATGTLQTLVPLVANFFESEPYSFEIDESVPDFNHFIVDVLDRNLKDPLFVAMAQSFGSLRAQLIAYLWSRGLPLHSDQATDILADAMLGLIDRNELFAALTGASDLGYLAAVKNLSSTPERARHTSEILNIIPAGAIDGNDRLEKIRQLTTLADRPLKCFPRGTHYRQIENIFDFIAQESQTRMSSLDSLNQFYLVEIPLLQSSMGGDCDLDPNLFQNLFALNDIVLQGGAVGLTESFGAFSSVNRLHGLKSVMKNSSFSMLGPVLENIAVSQSVPYLLDLVRQDLSADSLGSFERLEVLYLLEDLKGAEAESWIRGTVEEGSKEALLKLLKSFPLSQRTLVNLFDNLNQCFLKNPDCPYTQAYSALYTALQNNRFSHSPEVAIERAWKKMLSQDPEYRQPLKAFVSALVESWKRSDGGLGTLMGIVAEATTRTSETPFQDWLRDVLLDQKFFDSSNPILLRVLRSSEFGDSVKLTGELASSGELERLSRFFISMMKSAQEFPVYPKPSDPYHHPTGNPLDLIQDRPFAPEKPVGSYGSCMALKEDLFEKTGEQLVNGLQCLNAKGDMPLYSEIAQTLKETQLNSAAASLIENNFVKSPFIHDVLDGLEAFYKSQAWFSLSKLFHIAMASYDFSAQLDPVLGASTESNAFGWAMKGASEVLVHPRVGNAVGALVEIISHTPVSQYEPNQNVIMTLEKPDVLKKQARTLVSDWSDAKFDVQYARAVQEFEQHKGDYFYRQNMYQELSPHQTENELVEMIQLLLRKMTPDEMAEEVDYPNDDPDTQGADITGDLEGVLWAVRKIISPKSGVNLQEFVQWATHTQRVKRYWVGQEGDPELRIVTPLDQLELLVQHSDFSVAGWIPFVGVDHMGTYFQLQIAKSVDLEDTLTEMKKNVDLGLWYVETINDQVKRNHLRNAKENMDVLETMIHEGYMAILQKIYQGLRAATPPKYRDIQDPEKNHMDLIHRPMRVAAMARLATSLYSLDQQGQLNNFVSEFVSFMQTFKDAQDGQRMRAAFEMFASSQVSKTTILRTFIRQMMETADDETRYNQLIKTLFHFNGALPILMNRSGGMWEALLAFRSNPLLLKEVLETAVNEMGEPNEHNLLFHATANLMTLNPVLGGDLKLILSPLFEPRPSDSYSRALTQMLVYLLDHKRPELKTVWENIKLMYDDPMVIELQPGSSLKTFATLNRGLFRVSGDFLSDEKEREAVRQLLSGLSSRHEIDSLLKEVDRLIQSGKISELMELLINNLKKGET